MNTTRKLASIRRIASIDEIPGADRIEVLTIDGWKVVAQKGQGHEVGKLVVYFEIDSFIPTEIAPFLTKDAAYPKEYQGVKGERLKTIKLKGTVSQGLILPLTCIPGYVCIEGKDFINTSDNQITRSDDGNIQNNKQE